VRIHYSRIWIVRSAKGEGRAQAHEHLSVAHEETPREEGGGSGEEPGEDPEDPDNPDNPGGNTPGEDDKDHFEVTQEGEVVTYTVYTAKGLEAWRAVAHANDYNTSKTKYNLVLAADIELPVPADGQSNWTPVGTTGNPYDGIVDGAGFTISNLLSSADLMSDLLGRQTMTES
jgi:hypothetical protein